MRIEAVLEHIRQVVKEKGYTEANLVRRSGLARPTVHKLLTGGGNVTVTTIRKLTNALKNGE